MLYFILRLGAFFVMNFTFKDEEEPFMKTITDDILLCSTIIFQYMMFRLKKIEILLNPLYSEPQQIQSRMRVFSCLMTCWILLYATLIIFSLAERIFHMKNVDDDLDKDDPKLLAIEFTTNALLSMMMLIITPYFAMMGLNYLSVLRSKDN